MRTGVVVFVQMQNYTDELLSNSVPLVALLSDAPFLDALAVRLKLSRVDASANQPKNQVNYLPLPLAHKFPAKQRSHGHEYETYVPAGILRTTWLEKHHKYIPSVIVSRFQLFVVHQTRPFLIIPTSSGIDFPNQQ